jgi:subtilisin family serine protease
VSLFGKKKLLTTFTVWAIFLIIVLCLAAIALLTRPSGHPDSAEVAQRITPTVPLQSGAEILAVTRPVTAASDPVNLASLTAVENLREVRAASTSDNTKVSQILQNTVQSVRMKVAESSRDPTVEPMDLSELSTPLVHVTGDGKIQSYVYVFSWGDAERAALFSNGVEIEIENAELGIVQAWVPYDQLERIAAREFVSEIAPPSYGMQQVGSVTTQGDSILRADQLRAYGIDGGGVTVGVISGGIRGLSDAQQLGDLPEVVAWAGDPSNAEGTAMLEIIHDLAPQATLGFCGLPTISTLEFIQCVELLSTTFIADVIVDDIVFFFAPEPYFEDGSVAQAVASAVAGGIIYVSSAGNLAEKHYQSDFLDNPLVPGAHDFGQAAGSGNDSFLPFILAPLEVITVTLQWNDPFGGAANDYDIGLFDVFGTLLVSSTNLQDGNDDPVEQLTYQNPSVTAPLSVNILANKFAGDSRVLEIYTTVSPLVYGVPDGSILGHQALGGVMAVVAINASDPGSDSIASYSSRGPSEIYFPALEVRDKPDLTGIDGVAVTGSGGFSSPFFGTSAAAPHVAGVAALIKSAFPALTTGQVRDAMTNSAVDILVEGPDTISGFGRVDALSAVQTLDADIDLVLNANDNCEFVSNTEQLNFDGDSAGDACDPDDDNDGVPDTEDALPLDPSESLDNDGDGIGNNADLDDDGDGMPDSYETDNGLDPLNRLDAFADADGDGHRNRKEFRAGTDPNDASSQPAFNSIDYLPLLLDQ